MSKMDRREIEARESAQILLVDDDPDLRNMIGILLDQMGLQCTAAESAEEAMLCLENQGYELVIVDKNLPGLSGLQLARIIHLLSPKTPILLITGYASEETARVHPQANRHRRFPTRRQHGFAPHQLKTR